MFIRELRARKHARNYIIKMQSDSLDSATRDFFESRIYTYMYIYIALRVDDYRRYATFAAR